MQYITDKIYKTRIFDAIGSSGGNDLFFDGISGSLKSFIISYIFTHKYNNIIYCAAESSKLFELKDDLNFILEKDFPEGTVSLYLDKYDEEYESEISPLSSVLKKITRNENYIVLLEPSVFVKDIISEDTLMTPNQIVEKVSKKEFIN